MTDWLQLLGRPQFSALKSFTIPSNIKLGKTGMQKLAAVCPHLEDMDAGFACESPFPTDADLVAASTLFPRLTKIGFNMRHATCNGAVTMARNLGERLLDLRIMGETTSQCASYLSDGDLENISRACPNLMRFTYVLRHVWNVPYEQAKDKLTGRGIQALIGNCSNLECLVLENTKNIDLAAFLLLGRHTKLSSLRLHGVPILFESEYANRVRLGLEMTIDDCDICAR